MKRGKRVFAIFIVLSILIISVIGVNAGWWNTITGNAPKDVSANVQISGTSSEPEIIYVSQPNRTTILEGRGVLFSFTFLAYSSAGTSFLPTSTETSRIGGYFNGTFNGFGEQNVIGTCTTVSDMPIDCIKGTASCINYTCDILMQYYYDSIDWGINASVSDDTGKTGSNMSVSFYLQERLAWDRNPDWVNWTGVSVGGDIKPSDNNININLTGNKDIDSLNVLSINATTLYKSGDDSKTIDGSNFTSPEIAPCDLNVDLNDNQFVDLTFFTIDHTSSIDDDPADADLLFCIKPLVNIDAGEYNTKSDRKWTISVLGA